MRFMFCLMCAGVTFLCILMGMVYLLLLNAVCFLSLDVVVRVVDNVGDQTPSVIICV